MAGRIVVATPEFGVPSKIFGSPSPIPPALGWTPTHAHSFEVSVATNAAGIFLISGCCAGGYGKSTTYTSQGVTSTNVSSALPLYMVQACVALA